jgi:hypothetical protein
MSREPWYDEAFDLAGDQHGRRANPMAACPACGKGGDGYVCAVAGNDDLEGAHPCEGDAALCAYCGSLNIYRAGLMLRPATEKERGEYADLIRQVSSSPKEPSDE